MYRWLRMMIDRHEARQAKKQRKEALDRYGWETKCPGCERPMHADDTVVRFRDTDYHWHYLCQCGTVIHYLLMMFPTKVGYGRWRCGLNAPGTPGGNLNGQWYPLRLEQGEPLYHYAPTDLHYVYSPHDKKMITLLTDQIPWSNRGFNIISLAIGTTVTHDGVDWWFDGVKFVVRNTHLE